jgi:hypothetical protein
VRPLVWVYRSTLQKSGLFMRGYQLSEMARRHIGGQVEIAYVDEIGAATVRDSVIYATRSFLADATTEELQSLRDAGNVICADYLDHPVRQHLNVVIDAYIASSINQAQWYRTQLPRKAVHYIPHHADPDIGNAPAPLAECRIAYFGELENALHREVLVKDVDFVRTRLVDRSWLADLQFYNVHYSVRDWRYPSPVREASAFKPFTKGFNAAACNANIIVPANESDASYILGLDYPYLLPDTSIETVRRMIDYVKESFGGPDWRRGLDIMAEARHVSSPEFITSKLLEMVKTYA